MFTRKRRSSGARRPHYPRFAGRGLRSAGRQTATFNPSQLINKVGDTPLTEVPFEPQNTFASFAISDVVKRNITTKGFNALTPIQDQIIPHIIDGRDVVGIANTGTGKTAAFLIPLIDKLVQEPSSKMLIIAPTRELADQINTEFMSFARGTNLFSAMCIGGVPINRQIQTLRRSVQAVIGTPGRIKDLYERRFLNLAAYNLVVLDEVDRMLDMGFIHDIRYIISKLPSSRHSLFFSATLPNNVRGVMESFLNQPIVVSIKSQKTSDQIEQDVIKVAGRNKQDILEELLKSSGFSKVLVFGASKWKLNRLEHHLQQRGFKVAAIHGNKSQARRMAVLRQFKNNFLQVLLATDVASRGLDIDDVTHVINFDMPQTYEDYIHRIGRTGRANKTGVALTFVD